jgi:hypothetical protein
LPIDFIMHPFIVFGFVLTTNLYYLQGKTFVIHAERSYR